MKTGQKELPLNEGKEYDLAQGTKQNSEELVVWPETWAEGMTTHHQGAKHWGDFVIFLSQLCQRFTLPTLKSFALFLQILETFVLFFSAMGW